MHHALTDEQIEKASGYLLAAFNWVLSDAELNQLATHLQFAPPQLSGDVVEAIARAQRATDKRSWEDLHEDGKEMHFRYATAAAQVLLVKVCGPVTNEEKQRHFFRNLIDSEPRTMLTSDVRFDEIMKDRYNSLLKPAEPPVPEEIKALLLDTDAPAESRPTRNFYNFNVLEAFKLGQKSGASHDR